MYLKINLHIPATTICLKIEKRTLLKAAKILIKIRNVLLLSTNCQTM